MIKIFRITIEDELAGRLDRRTSALRASNADSVAARKAWTAARAERRGIREQLVQMAPGIERCMYCGDNRATDIDHFEPIRELPTRTFEWLNHLLACSTCNSNQKRDRFPRDPSGAALLLDPTQDDPVRHLRLILRTGDYRPLTPQGEASVAVFGLNRRDLTRGRAGAFEMAKAALCRTHDLLKQGRHDEAHDCVRALTEQPHASVLQEILRSAALPGAVDVLGTDLVAALTDQEVLALLPDFTRPSTSG
jgi:HNH endonuclease